jgi:salicylate hydroxylase
MRIAIIGCGPGGLASALLLHRAGHQITLFDQFDRPKPMGSGLLIQPSGQSVLAELGLLQKAQNLSAPVQRLYGVNTANGKRALDMAYYHLGPDVHALGIHRASLFDILFDAVCAAGIAVTPNSKLIGVAVGDNDIVPHFENGVGNAFDITIDASGANAPLAGAGGFDLPFAALWTTVDIPKGSSIADAALDQRYVAAYKMAGIMPIGINPATGNQGAALFWSIKPDRLPALKKAGIASWRKEFLEIWPEAKAFAEQVASLDNLTLAIYRHRTGRPVSNGRIFHIGDSWHCTSPQLGQGANMALMDAKAISAAVVRADSVAEIARHYEYLRSDHVRLYQLLSRLFTPLYQSDSRLLAVLRDNIIHSFARWPLVRNVIAHVVSGNLGNFARY